jgi:hypothetical protein
MFEAFGNHPERQRLHVGDGFITVGAVAHDTSQGGHLGEPATVVFAFDLDRKDHVATVPSGGLPNKRMDPTRQLLCARVTAALLIRKCSTDNTRKESHRERCGTAGQFASTSVAAIDAGDTVTSERLLALHPRLVREWLRRQQRVPAPLRPWQARG